MVTFNSGGGTTEADPATKTVTDPATTIDVLPTPPAKTGYTFGGWYTEQNGGGSAFTASSTVSGDITVYAKWDSYSYTVTFDSDGGTAANPATETVASPTTTIDGLPVAPTRTGYNFGGWYTEPGGLGTSFTALTEVTANITVYAKWTGVTYTVKFMRNYDGEVTLYTKTVTVPATAIDALPAEPTRMGYIFGGWKPQADGSGTAFTESSTVSASITVYAQWTPINYTVIYNANGGSGGDISYSHTYEDWVQIIANTFTKTGYSFVRWNTAADGTGTSYGVGDSVQHISFTDGAVVTLYAQWTAIPYNITYHLNGGTNGANPAGYTIEDTDITLVAATRDDYTFGGWYDNDEFNGTAVTSIPTGSTGDKAFYAKWNPGALIQITLQAVPSDPVLSTISIDEDQEAVFSATGTGYESWKWYWDGTLLSENTSTYTLAANSQSPGIYELSVVVTTDEGVKLSARCRVTVNAKGGV
jgi:uncharacterized repeat protein (TIGR02543 family)